MKRLAVGLGVVALAAASFVAGTRARGPAPSAAGAGAHAHHQHGGGGGGGGAPATLVTVSPEQQQLVGVRVVPVQHGPSEFVRRLPARVAVDENRVYRINAAVDGWIQELLPVTVGTLVKKDQPLLTFYSPEFLGPQQALFYALNAMDRFRQGGGETAAQIALTEANIQQATDSLKNLGMGDVQIAELRRTRLSTQRVAVRAPGAGFVTARNVFAGQRIERGSELFRIADLGRVWIVADAFEGEGDLVQPRTEVKVSVPQLRRTLTARVSDVLPQFDPASRTLKVRLDAQNPGFVLRPDMFVEVELPVRLPMAFTVPAEAVLDSGLGQTVFVDRGGGTFERRAVTTGWRFSDRVEVRSGLHHGERVVASGTFLLDADSRMRAGAPEVAAAGMAMGHEGHVAPAAPMDHSQHGEHAGHDHD